MKVLRGFIGLTNSYRKFIRGYSLIATLLTTLLKKNFFLWTDETIKSFEELNREMTQPPMLRLLDFTQKFTIECDANGISMGGSDAS